VLELARDAGVAVGERPITVHELATTDEAFSTGTAAEVAAAGRGEREADRGPVTSDRSRAVCDRFKSRRTSGTLIFR